MCKNQCAIFGQEVERLRNKNLDLERQIQEYESRYREDLDEMLLRYSEVRMVCMVCMDCMLLFV